RASESVSVEVSRESSTENPVEERRGSAGTQAHPRDAGLNHVELACGRLGDVDDPPARVGTAVVDADLHLPAVAEVLDVHAGPEAQLAVRRGVLVAVEALAGSRGAPLKALPVPARLSGPEMARGSGPLAGSGTLGLLRCTAAAAGDDHRQPQPAGDPGPRASHHPQPHRSRVPSRTERSWASAYCARLRWMSLKRASPISMTNIARPTMFASSRARVGIGRRRICSHSAESNPKPSSTGIGSRLMTPRLMEIIAIIPRNASRPCSALWLARSAMSSTEPTCLWPSSMVKS